MSVDPLYFGVDDFTWPIPTASDSFFGVEGFVFPIPIFPPMVLTALVDSPAEILGQLLKDMTLGTDPILSPQQAWPVYVTDEPDGTGTQDNVITTYDTMGFEDGRTMYDGEYQRHPGVQIRIRSVNHRTGWQKSDQIFSTLSKSFLSPRNVTVSFSGLTYLVDCVNHMEHPICLGKEAPTSKRRIFTINVALTIEQC